MGQLDKDKAAHLAGTLHEAVGTTGDVQAQKAKLQATNKLLVEASVVTRNDNVAQKNVVRTLNESLHRDGYHVEGYGSQGNNSYLLMRQLNKGKGGKATEVAYCPIATDGTVNMQAVPRDANGRFRLPGEVVQQPAPAAKSTEVPGPTGPVQTNPTEAPRTAPVQTGPSEVPEEIEPAPSNKKQAAAVSSVRHTERGQHYAEPLNPAVRFIRSETNSIAESAPVSAKAATAEVTPAAVLPASAEEVRWQQLADSQREAANKLREIANLPDAAAREQALKSLDVEMKVRVLGTDKKVNPRNLDCEARAQEIDKLAQLADGEATKMESLRLKASAPEAGTKATAAESIPVAEAVAAPEVVGVPKASRFNLPEILNSPTTGRMAVGGLSGLGAVVGLWQINAGAQQVANGDTGIGSLRMLGGGANLGAGLLGFNTLAKNPYTWAAPMAMRLGGGANLIGGGLELYNGLKTGDGVQTFDGAVYATSGALMLRCPTNPIGWGAAVAGTSYSFTRLAMEYTGGDKVVTGMMDSVWNAGTNREAADISKANRENLKNQGANVVLQSYEQMKVSNTSAKDVTNVILGLREEMQAMRTAGKNVSDVEAEVKRLTEIRGVLAQEQQATT